MLYLSLLGSPQIHWNGKPVRDLTSAKSQALLFYLALNRRPQSRLRLAGLLWPEKSDQEALVNLRQTLYLLRQSLPDVIAATRANVGLNGQIPLAVDALDFEAGIMAGLSGDIESLRSAIDGYGGEFLSGFFVDEAPGFSDWIAVEQERLRALMIQGLIQLSDHYLNQKEIGRGILYTGKLLALEPWREESHRQMMQLLAWDGQTQAALTQYEHCRQLLADELDTEPSAETTALWEQIQTGSFARLTPSPKPVHSPSGLSHIVEWGDAPALLAMHGRAAEMAKLEEEIIAKQRRLVAVLGMGGQGKTTLAAAFARTHTSAFGALLWRTLLNVPPLDDVLQGWLEKLIPESAATIPQSLDGKLDLLFDQLRNKRCLLILDNAESIMQGGQHAGAFRSGYEPYDQLLRRFALGEHKSCLLLTSREKPDQFSRLERRESFIYSLALPGLDVSASHAILQEEKLHGSEAEIQKLIQQYSGNPLALILIADTINDLYKGDVGAFLKAETTIFENVQAVLAQQFNRLTPLELQVMLWLAVERESVDITALGESILLPHTQAELLMAVRSLERRSLIEKRDDGFTLQNVLMEFSTDYLIASVVRELLEQKPDYFAKLPLIKAQAKPYIRRAQERLILQPVAGQLSSHAGPAHAILLLKEQVRLLHPSIKKHSYAGGNLLNLLLHLGAEDKLDFSDTAVWQAHLRGKDLPPINFNGSDLSGSSFTDYGGSIMTLAFSPDGKYLAGSAQTGELRLWDFATKQLVRVFDGHGDFVAALCFSPNGNHLVSGGGDGVVCLWDVETGRRLHAFPAHDNSIYSVAYSPNGDWIVGVSFNRLTFWNPISGESLFSQDFPGGYIGALALSHDGKIFALSNQTKILLFDAQATLTSGTCNLLRELQGHQAVVRRLVFSPDDQKIAGSGDHVSVWDVATGRQLHTFSTQNSLTWGLAFHPAMDVLVSGSTDAICLWHVKTGELLRAFSAHEQPIVSLAFSPDGQVLASSGDDNRVRFWDLDGQNLHTIQGYVNLIHTLDLSPDGKYLACGTEDRKTRLWDYHSGELLNVWDDHQSPIWRVTFSPDGQTLATCSLDRLIRVFAIQSGEERYQLQTAANRIFALTYSPDGCWLATGDRDGTVTLWNSRTGHREKTFLHNAFVCDVAFRPNGMQVAVVCFDQNIYIWDIESGKCLQTLSEHDNEVWTLAYSRDGRFLVSGSDDCTFRIWDASTGECLHALKHHTGWVTMVAINQAGNRLAIGSQDKTISLWDMELLAHGEAPRLVHHLTGHTARVVVVRFTPDDTTVISGSLDETMRLWRVDTGECNKIWRIPGPYEGMSISNATGLTMSQRRALKSLGAVE